MTGDPNNSKGKVTGLLHAWMSGDQDAFNQAVELVYPELRKIAHGHLSKERPGHVLQTTALVNESYIRLARLRRMSWSDRAHFCAMSARVMRRILVDDSRKRNSAKRGGSLILVSLDEVDSVAQQAANVLAVDEALKNLETLDLRQRSEKSLKGDLSRARHQL